MEKEKAKKLWKEIMKGKEIQAITRTTLQVGTYPEKNLPHWWEDKMTTEVLKNDRVCNLLPSVMVNSIRALLEYFPPHDQGISQQVIRDLFAAKFRLFDCMGMWVDSFPNEPHASMDCTVVKIMLWEFLHSCKDEILWQKNIVATDYDMMREWEKLY